MNGESDAYTQTQNYSLEALARRDAYARIDDRVAHALYPFDEAMFLLSTVGLCALLLVLPMMELKYVWVVQLGIVTNAMGVGAGIRTLMKHNSKQKRNKQC
jgi:hypothetical protein